MCRAEGMALCPWGVVGQGKYKSEDELRARGTALRYGTAQTAAERGMSAALAKVAAELGGGATLGAVAVAWVMHKTPYVFPVVGGHRPEQLLELIKVSRRPSLGPWNLNLTNLTSARRACRLC